MADHSKPSTNGTDPKLDVLSMLMARIDDAVKFFRGVTPSNIPDGTVRFNDAQKRFEKWSSTGSSWSELVDQYGINVDRVDTFHAVVVATANSIPVRDSSAKVPGDITGDAATVAGKKPTSVSGGTLVELVSGKVPTGYLPSLTGDATTLEGHHTSTVNTPVISGATTIPLRDTDGRINAHVAGNVSSPNNNYGTGQVGSATDFLALYGKCMGGGFGANSGIILQAVPGSYNWTVPDGVNKVLCVMWGGGGGGPIGSDGSSSTFSTLATAGGGHKDGTPGTGGGALGLPGKSGNWVMDYNSYAWGTGDSNIQGFMNVRHHENHTILGQMHGVCAHHVPVDYNDVEFYSGNGGIFMDFLTVVPGATYNYAVGAGGLDLYSYVPATGGAVLLIY